MKYTSLIAFIGVSMAHKLSQQDSPSVRGLPWDDHDFFEKNDGQIGYYMGHYSAARKNAPITNKMEKEDAEDGAAAANKVYQPWRPSSHDHDDTGSEYYANWKCFGKKCPDKAPGGDDHWGAKRPYVS